MSTDLKNPPPAPSEPREPDKPKLDLSLAQILGGALAAMTAAFLGSRLSVAGTVVGAALASVVAAVAGNVYTASLRTTHDRVRTVFQERATGSGRPATGAADAAVDRTPDRGAPQDRRTASPDGRGLSVRSMLLGALTAFALAAAVLTGIELATGQALSGGDGTTISQVEERGTAPDPVPTGPAAPSASASPGDSPEPTPSDQVSTSTAPGSTPSAPPASPSPSPAETSPATPSATPTPIPTPTSTPESPGAEG